MEGERLSFIVEASVVAGVVALTSDLETSCCEVVGKVSGGVFKEGVVVSLIVVLETVVEVNIVLEVVVELTVVVKLSLALSEDTDSELSI